MRWSPTFDEVHGDAEQFRGTGAGRDVERQQRPVPVRAQRCEQLIEEPVGQVSRDPLGHPLPERCPRSRREGLHRIVVRLRPSSGSVVRVGDRIDQRPVAVADPVGVEHLDDREGVVDGRRRVPDLPTCWADQPHPQHEVACLEPTRALPGHIDRGQEPPPSQQRQAVGAQRAEARAAGQHRREELADLLDRLARGIQQHRAGRSFDAGHGANSRDDQARHVTLHPRCPFVRRRDETAARTVSAAVHIDIDRRVVAPAIAGGRLRALQLVRSIDRGQPGSAPRRS